MCWREYGTIVLSTFQSIIRIAKSPAVGEHRDAPGLSALGNLRWYQEMGKPSRGSSALLVHMIDAENDDLIGVSDLDAVDDHERESRHTKLQRSWCKSDVTDVRKPT
jgi:hypothetical protein